MINKEDEEASKSNSTSSGNIPEGMDRNEGETDNGAIGGDGSELDEDGKRLNEERGGGEQNTHGGKSSQ